MYVYNETIKERKGGYIMKKEIIIASVVAGVIAVGGASAAAGRFVKKSITCPNCGTIIEQTESERGRRMQTPKTAEELKEELAARVASGEITQEQMDAQIAKCEEMQKKAEERKAEQAAKLEEVKAELAAKVAAGEITQEEMDKQLENLGNRGRGRGMKKKADK